jgi:hypothetical protein
MVLRIGSAELRRSEMIALTWSDLNMKALEVRVLSSCVRNLFGPEKIRHPSAPSETEQTPNQDLEQTHCRRFIGGPDRDRTDDLFHAMV